MNLTQLIDNALGILSVTTGDAAARTFALMAINAAKQQAELNYDWRFSWSEETFVMNGQAKFDLTTQNILLKSIEFVEVWVVNGKWVEASVVGGKWERVPLLRMKTQDGRTRKAEKENSVLYTGGESVLLVQGNSLYCSDKEQADFSARASGYFFTVPFESESDIEGFFLVHGWEYLLWYAVVFMNKKYGVFLPRQEGAQPEPKSMYQDALVALQNYDTFQHEGAFDNEMNY